MTRVLKYCFNESDFDSFDYEVTERELVEALANIILDDHKQGLCEEEIKGAKLVIRRMLENGVLDLDWLFDNYELELFNWFEDDARENYNDCCWEEEHQDYLRRHFNENR